MKQLPKLRKHKSSGVFYYRVDRVDHYLWKDKKKSEKEYLGRMKDLAEALQRDAPPPPAPVVRDGSALVTEVLTEYWEARSREKLLKTERAKILRALESVRVVAGSMRAADFRAKDLRRVSQYLLDRPGKNGQPASRKYVNGLLNRIRAVWRWLAIEDLVPHDAAGSLQLFRNIKEGHAGVDRPEVLPATREQVDATLPYLKPDVRAIVQLIMLTGARPGEICGMKREQLSTGPHEPLRLGGKLIAGGLEDGVPVWLLHLPHHKTAKKGKIRVLAFGPKAQEVVRPFLTAEKTGRLFERSSEQVRKAIIWAVLRCNQERQRAGGQLIPEWFPYQLRHLKATELVEQFDVMTASAALGHASPRMLAVYAEQAIGRAARAAAKAG